MRRRVYRGLRRRGGPSGGRLAVLTLMFWIFLGVVIFTLVNGGPGSIVEGKGEDIGKFYIGNIFPSISRSADYESRTAMNQNPEASVDENAGDSSDGKKGLLHSMIGSMYPAVTVLDDDLAEEDPGIIFDPETTGDTKTDNSDEEQATVIDTQNPESPKPATAHIDYSKPVVIIYHTHATESYQPVTEGNFHSLNEYGTVREVGDVMTAELEAKGIQVIHDKTVHDSPSYNQSYSRSLETIQKLMGENKTTQIVVDLHRDAASYSGNVGKSVTIKKETVAKYSLVVGTGNPNVEALKLFANHINKKAEDLYPGFGGKIIEKQYKFNQYVSDYHILLEVGNNQNTIEEAKACGKYFADVLAESIKDIE
jgi:stage II sporulation protein P